MSKKSKAARAAAKAIKQGITGDKAAVRNLREAIEYNDIAALARSRKIARQAKDIFTDVPAPPFPIGDKGSPSIAMDEAYGNCVGQYNEWANGALLGMGYQGQGFLGYAFLSELAQRPEYRVISETIATEMTRKWIEFTSLDDDGGQDEGSQKKIKELSAEFDRLNVRAMFARATQQDGFLGRGHIYVDTGDTDNPDELKTPIGDGWDKASKAKIKKGSLQALRTVEATWCYPTNYNSINPLRDDWYRPNSWYVQGIEVHSSRLVTFVGREVPDMLKPSYSFGGMSLSQLCMPYVDNWLETRTSVNSIISAFSVFVLSTNMAATTQGAGQRMFARAAAFNEMRDNTGLMMIDKEQETFQNVSASLAGLEGLQAQAQEHMASVSRIPTVKLLGIQPAGLNADSEGVMRSFYDFIGSFQEHLFRDKIRRVMGLCMLNLWGSVDESIGFNFVPLWSMDEKGEAEVNKLKAETDTLMIADGVISPEEARMRIAHDPSSGHAGLDPTDVPDLLDEEAEGLQPKGSGKNTAVEEKAVDTTEKGDNAMDSVAALDRLFKAEAA